MEDRIINLEIKITEQEHLLEELNGVVFEQAQKIENLEAKIQLLVDKYRQFLESDEEEIHNEKPPHY